MYVLGDKERSAGSWLIYIQEAGKWCICKGGHRDYILRIALEFGKVLLWV